jgi:site-specific DNA-methyltransferase (adenine-specific)
MTPAFNLHIGDALERLRALPADSAQTCVTSPPYYGLRDYGVEGQIGLEPTRAEYVQRLVEVFGEVRRVLRPDGTAWINLGDTYASDAWGCSRRANSTINGGFQQRSARAAQLKLKSRLDGLKPKDKLGIPWRVAFALQEDGWWLRSDVVWAKPNPMPESVRDRPTVSHEFVFLISKSERYFYNTEEARERCVAGAAHSRGSGINPKAAAKAFTARLRNGRQNASFSSAVKDVVEFRNWRDVWTIQTQPSSLEHFAAFPESLAQRCIVAGSRPGDTVLDPFAGTGTTGVVALREGRRFVGVELNPAYAEMAERRARNVTRPPPTKERR